MRLVTGISIATLAVSVAALVLVLWLVVTEPWEPDAQSANKGHTQELDADAVVRLIDNHVSQLIESEGLSNDDDDEAFKRLPGYRCFWKRYLPENTMRTLPFVYDSDDRSVTYNYMEKDDIWLVTSVYPWCKSDFETWTIDDNTGAITYGRLP